jgi:hypothetical protein
LSTLAAHAAAALTATHATAALLTGPTLLANSPALLRALSALLRTLAALTLALLILIGMSLLSHLILLRNKAKGLPRRNGCACGPFRARWTSKPPA